MVATLVAAAVAALLTSITQPRVLILGLGQPGPATEYGLPIVKGIFDLSAALTIGWLLAAAWLVPPARSGTFTVGGYRAVRAASACAFVWVAAGLMLVPLNTSEGSGESLVAALSADQILVGLSALTSISAPLQAAGVALVVALLARVLLRPGGAWLLMGLAVVGLLPIALAGHTASSGAHDIASDTMIYHLVGVSLWVGGLVALVGLTRQRVSFLPVIARRYSAVALIAFVAVSLSGIGNAWIRFSSPADLFSTDYGRLVLVKAALLVLLGVLGALHRSRTLRQLDSGRRAPLLRLAGVEVLLMAATVGVAVALGRTATPPPSGVVPGGYEEILGYPLPGRPTVWTLLMSWRFDLMLGTLSVVAIVLYLVGVLRLRRRGIGWPIWRTIPWVVGWLMVLMATSSGFGRYGAAQFSIHMIDHMALGMMAPILLVLGGPITLALRVLPAAGPADPPGMREQLVRMVHSPLARWITHPLVVFFLFIGSFYALYFTSLFQTLMSGHLGHLAMNLHFLLVGYLYYWVIIGVDPSPRRLHPMAKLGLLLGALPFHAFFGLALMQSRTSIAPDYFGGLNLPWVNDIVADQRLGGAIAWGATEVPIIIVVIALLSQWSASDARQAKRADKLGDTRADDELDAYNAMLAELAFRDVEQRPESGRAPRRSADDDTSVASGTAPVAQSDPDSSADSR